MNTQRNAKPALTTLESNEEAQVAQYLKRQPDFFERHAELLAHLTLPHDIGGSAVSLVERQTSILRKRNSKLDKRLRELVKIASTNQELSDKTHKLTIKLLAASTIEQVAQVVESTLREDFGSQRAALVLFASESKKANITSNSFVRPVVRSAASLKPFHTFMEGAKPRCGQIRDAQKEFLFGPDNIEIGSAALLPIGEQSELGMLAIGNRDAHHFHPAMSTDFLVRLGESVTAAIRRFADQLS